jgi:hypothetical protein
MGQHYTKDTVEAPIFCNKCMRFTQWRILGGKPAFCIPCYEKNGEIKITRNPAMAQMDLFLSVGEYGRSNTGRR